MRAKTSFAMTPIVCIFCRASGLSARVLIRKRQRTRKSLAAYVRDASDRNEAIRFAYASGGYSLQAIGDHFDLHYATVSRLVRAGDV